MTIAILAVAFIVVASVSAYGGYRRGAAEVIARRTPPKKPNPWMEDR